MRLQARTLEKLRDLITHETEYRTGPQLVAFFNGISGNDIYGQGFPSRHQYVLAKLELLNGTADLDKCIKLLFAPLNFVNQFKKLEDLIREFNKYLAFDGWQIVRGTKEISFKRASEETLVEMYSEDLTEVEFLSKEFKDVPLDKIGLSLIISDAIALRFTEIEICLRSKANLAAILLCGSSLEGILLGLASKDPSLFNGSERAPKDKFGQVKKFHEWNLANFIEVGNDLGIIKEDVRKFSHALRNFRNYIHPFEQISTGFYPSHHTAKICWQVLRAAVFQISDNMVSKIQSV